MAAPRHIRKKLAKQKLEASREQLIANAEKRLPPKKLALLEKVKNERRDT